MSTRPTIAVGVPVFNGARFLGAGIAALLAQTRVPDQIVIADNASTDDSLSLARALAAAEPRIRVITSDVNLGAARNFNRLVDATDADLFAWAPADDLWTPDLLAAQEAALADPGVVGAYGDTVYIDADGAETGRPDPVVWSDAPDAPTRIRELLRGDPFHSHLHVCSPVVGLLRRDALLETRRIQPFGGSDKALIVELALRGRLTPVTPVIHRRRHAEASVTANPDADSRRRWFDPSSQGPATPTSSLFGAMIGATRRAPLSTGERVRITAEILRWLTTDNGLRASGGEMKMRLRWRLGVAAARVRRPRG